MQHTEILSYEEFKKRYPAFTHRNAVCPDEKYGRFCKALRLKDMILGTYALPDKKDPSKKLLFGYFLTSEKLLLIGPPEALTKMLQEIETYITEAPDTPVHALFELLEFLIKDDILCLQEYETHLSALEDALLKNTVESFNHKMLKIRKELSSLSLYYQQLSDIGDTLCEQAAETENEKLRQLFDLFSAKAKRLYSTVQSLKEYSMQLKELYHTQLDIKQNTTMKVLTIVTTIFMPLTLIAGWYGMNFSHMPELTSRYGYPIICAVSGACLIIEILFFKKKKWF